MLIVLAWWAVAILSAILGGILIEKGFLTGCSVFFISILLHIVAFLETIAYVIELVKH